MHLECLGTSGYHPNEARHTSCYFVPDAASDCAFVLDAGTGFFRLAFRPLPAHLHIFLTHAHLDHVCGLTFLLDVLFNKETEVTVYGDAKTLNAVCSCLFDSPLFPLPFEHKMQEIIPDQPFEVAGVQVSTFELTHPAGALAYRFDWPQSTLAYVTDTAGDGRYIDFIRDADLLIHERNFPNILEKVADASGHCTSDAAIEAVRQSGAKKVLLTHFNPLQMSDPLEDDDLRAQLPNAVAAYDGLEVEF
jgi:ribonuclease BN (tRNA processing enzyme)